MQYQLVYYSWGVIHAAMWQEATQMEIDAVYVGVCDALERGKTILVPLNDHQMRYLPANEVRWFDLVYKPQKVERGLSSGGDSLPSP